LSASRDWNITVTAATTPPPVTTERNLLPIAIIIAVLIAAGIGIVALARRKKRAREEPFSPALAPGPAVQYQAMGYQAPPLQVPSPAQPPITYEKAPQQPAPIYESAPELVEGSLQTVITELGSVPTETPGRVPELVPEPQVDTAPEEIQAESAPMEKLAPGAPRIVQKEQAENAPGRVEDLFLLYMDGRLIAHATAGGERRRMDPEIFGAMLTALQEFVKDSFSSGDQLSMVTFGKKNIFIQRGPQIFLAAVVKGGELPRLKEKMRRVIITIWDDYKVYLKKWDGCSDNLQGLTTVLKTAFQD
jgi:hypothetical protein